MPVERDLFIIPPHSFKSTLSKRKWKFPKLVIKAGEGGNGKIALKMGGTYLPRTYYLSTDTRVDLYLLVVLKLSVTINYHISRN